MFCRGTCFHRLLFRSSLSFLLFHIHFSLYHFIALPLISFYLYSPHSIYISLSQSIYLFLLPLFTQMQSVISICHFCLTILPSFFLFVSVFTLPFILTLFFPASPCSAVPTQTVLHELGLCLVSKKRCYLLSNGLISKLCVHKGTGRLPLNHPQYE